MDIKKRLNLSSLNGAIDEFKSKVIGEMEAVGIESVEVAKESGKYHDVTGRLRASNKYEVSEEGLKLYNDAPYASDVEARGGDVLSSAILYAEKRLKEIFE